jgi:hypothetical protein
MRRDEMREKQLARDTLGDALSTMEKQAEDIKRQRDESKSAYSAIDQKSALALQTLAALVR